MNVLQSYVSTVGGGHMDMYQLRVWMKIVERAQEVMTSSLACKYQYSDEDVHEEHMRFFVQLKDLLSPGDRHYDRVKDALKALSAHQIEHYDSSSRTWRSSTLIYDCLIEEGTGCVTWYVSRWVFEYILTFTQGFCRYHLETAMSMRSANCIILYMLTCNLQHAVTYNISVLKAITGDSDKYKNNSDYVKNVIAKVSDELESMKVNGYTYNIIKKGCRIDCIEIKPVKRQSEELASLTAQISINNLCDYSLKTYLVNQCFFSVRELSAHKDLLYNFGKMPGWQEALLSIVERQRKKRAGKGYIINGIRSVLREQLPIKYEEVAE